MLKRKENGCISRDDERALREFVSREVIMLASHLVADLFEVDKLDIMDFSNLKKTDEELKDEGYEDIEQARDNGEDYQEIFEYWFVSEWLYKDLEAQNEPVLDSPYGYIWGRTCTGQGIAMDSVIEAIYCKIKS